MSLVINDFEHAFGDQTTLSKMSNEIPWDHVTFQKLRVGLYRPSNIHDCAQQVGVMDAS